MAKYKVTRACGHEETVILYGKIKTREWRLEFVEPEKLCYDCYQAELAKKREEENRQAAEAAKEQGLPELTGTEKQVAWAETLRQKLIAEIEELIKKVPAEKKNDPQFHEALKAFDYIQNITKASWFIDNRYSRPIDVLNRVHRHMKDEEEQVMETEAKKIEEEKELNAKAEATVRPENPVTETVAEIRALEDSVEISFPERRDDFREIVKNTLRMRWDRDKSQWRRVTNKKSGAPVDRAVEAGYRLLVAGFPVRIYDEELRQKAIAGDYEPECTRWIMKRVSGDYAGWFVIEWGRGEDFYKVARKISGSKYDRPDVVVPPEKYDEVLDFAEMYEFQLSEGAQEVVETARRIKENSVVANIELPKEKQKLVPSDKPPVLEVPEEVDIADELKD